MAAVFVETKVSLLRHDYRGTSLTRKRPPLGPYRRPMPQDLGGSYGGGRFKRGTPVHPKKVSEQPVLERARNISKFQVRIPGLGSGTNLQTPFNLTPSRSRELEA